MSWLVAVVRWLVACWALVCWALVCWWGLVLVLVVAVVGEALWSLPLGWCVFVVWAAPMASLPLLILPVFAQALPTILHTCAFAPITSQTHASHCWQRQWAKCLTCLMLELNYLLSQNGYGYG